MIKEIFLRFPPRRISFWELVTPQSMTHFDHVFGLKKTQKKGKIIGVEYKIGKIVKNREVENS